MKSMLAVQIFFVVILIFLIFQTYVLLLNLINKHDPQEQHHTIGYGSTLLAWLLYIVSYKFVIAPYTLFKQLKILNPTADPVIGNLREMASVGFNKFMLDNIKKFGNVFGIYIGRRPILCIADPDMLKQILVKDFDTFKNRSTIIRHIKKPMDLSLLMVRNADIWKKIRSVVSSSVSAGHLKRTVPLICECLESVEDDFQTAATERKSLDVWLACGKFTSDITSAFVSTTLRKSPSKDSNKDNADFNAKMEEVLSFKIFLMILDALNIPEWLRNIFVNYLGGHDVTCFLDDLKPVIEERRQSQSGIALQRDLLDMMTKNESGVTKLTDDEIMAQCIIVLSAGHQTTKSVLAFSAYLLALNPDIQDRLYDEVKHLDLDNSVQSLYDSVQKLEYLDQVFSEVLRYYPPVYFLLREASEDYIYNGIQIPKGMEILIPIYAIHHDAVFWEDPERFDPERFSPERSKYINPCSYIPFGYGPRKCVASRLAQLEAKIALVHFVKQFKFEKSADTEVPPSIRLGLMMFAEHGIYLKISARN